MSGKRRSIVAAALLTGLLVGGCSTPVTGAGTLAEAKHRIVDLVNQTAEQIGTPVEYQPAKNAASLPCRKHFLGYTVSRLSTHRAEIADPIAFTSTSEDGASLLPRVEAYWKSRGWPVDRSGMSDRHYPKLRTHVGGDLLVATGYVHLHQINLYGVTECVRS